MSKQGLDLDRVVLLGRTLEEYRRCFSLELAALGGKAILDVAAGVSSFTAEAAARGLNVTAFDRIYALPIAELESRCRIDLDHVVDLIADLSVYRWDFYKSAEGMKAYRQCAYQGFLADFAQNGSARYVAGALPKTPFQDRQFNFSLVSYLLFVYQDQLSYEFHRESIRELMRITAGEIRIYPIVTFEARRSEFLDRIVQEPDFQQWDFTEIRTDFEFLRNSNSYLSIQPRT